MKIWMATLAFAAMAAVAPTHAATVNLVDNSYVVSSSTAPTVNALALASPGALTVRVTDLLWPAALESLSFSVRSATGQVVGSFSGAGTRTFDVASGGMYYAIASGRPASSAFAFGSYGVRVDFAPVPLPASALLLLSGLALLATRVRRNCHQGVRQAA